MSGKAKNTFGSIGIPLFGSPQAPGNKPNPLKGVKAWGDGPLRPEEISSAEAHLAEPPRGKRAYRIQPKNWRGKATHKRPWVSMYSVTLVQLIFLESFNLEQIKKNNKNISNKILIMKVLYLKRNKRESPWHYGWSARLWLQSKWIWTPFTLLCSFLNW